MPYFQTVFLIGAGCSAEAGIPTSIGLTQAISADIQESDNAAFFQCWELAMAALKPTYKNPDIERVYNLLEFISDHNNHPANALLNSEHAIFAWLNAKTANSEAVKELMRFIKGKVRRHCRLDPKKDISYLNPIVERLKKTSQTLFLASLNYDDVFETLCHQHGLSCTTGLNHWEASHRLNWYFYSDGAVAAPRVELLKLHGSVNWYQNDQDCYRESSIEPLGAWNPAMILGGKNKLTAKGPYLSMLPMFRYMLSYFGFDLNILGYGFWDEHINEFISSSMRSGKQKVRIFSPMFPDHENVPPSSLL